jgi:hypothetical protein
MFTRQELIAMLLTHDGRGSTVKAAALTELLEQSYRQGFDDASRAIRKDTKTSEKVDEFSLPQ